MTIFMLNLVYVTLLNACKLGEKKRKKTIQKNIGGFRLDENFRQNRTKRKVEKVNNISHT